MTTPQASRSPGSMYSAGLQTLVQMDSVQRPPSQSPYSASVPSRTPVGRTPASTARPSSARPSPMRTPINPKTPTPSTGGVWVSQDLWRSIRRQLEMKLQEINTLTEDHIKVRSELQAALEKSEVMCRELQERCTHVDQALREERSEKERLADKLAKEVAAGKEAAEAARREYVAQTEQLMAMLTERDNVTRKADHLSKSLDETAFNLKLEAHRHTMSDERVSALEKELAYYKDKHSADSAVILELEAKGREQTAQMSEMAVQMEALKEELLLIRRPDEALHDEVLRLQTDNRRMMHLLERTNEYKHMMTDMAELKNTHYVSLAECLMDSEYGLQFPYTPERDREILLNKEAYYWIPKQAFELVQAFLDKMFPRVPTQPFMMLLLQLNKVWRDHEQAKMQALKAKHGEEVQKYKRRLSAKEPYQEIIQRSRIDHLKKELRTATKKGEKIERYRAMAKGFSEKDGNGEHKVLLEWGLTTIDKLSKQTSEMLAENRQLKRRLGAVVNYHGLPPDAFLHTLEADQAYLKSGGGGAGVAPSEVSLDLPDLPTGFTFPESEQGTIPESPETQGHASGEFNTGMAGMEDYSPDPH